MTDTTEDTPPATPPTPPADIPPSTLAGLQSQLAALEQQIPNLAQADQTPAKLQVLQIKAQIDGLALDDVSTALAAVPTADLDTLQQQIVAAGQAAADQAKLAGYVNSGLSTLSGILTKALAATV